eukprot:GEMP01054330.1.p1 GENE.GEMP01054330.1~~GEMP01054330.1.p1  ORF type:complete len:315 (+),score=84.42 GEMP01054330.1:199-1143(+)
MMDGPRLDDALRREKFNPTQYITTVATSDDDIWEIKQIFDLFDVNHRGFISPSDLQTIKEILESAPLSSMEYEDSEAYRWMGDMEIELKERQDEFEAEKGVQELDVADLAWSAAKVVDSDDEDAKSIFSIISNIADSANDAPWKAKERSKMDDQPATPSSKKQESPGPDRSITPSPTSLSTPQSKAAPRMVSPSLQPSGHVRRDSRSSLTGHRASELAAPLVDKRGITFDDFLHYITPRMCEDDSESQLRECWDAYFDKDQNESITVDELEQVARNANIDVSLDELEDMIDHADENLDGLVTFEDFCNVIIKKA